MADDTGSGTGSERRNSSGTGQRMSDAEALMWSVERDPMLRSTIVAVLVFDRSLDHARLKDKVDRASRTISQLRQRVMANPISIAPPRWEVDPDFDLEYHLRVVRCPGGGTLADVLAVAEPLAMAGFDPARPLWEMHVVQDMADERSALIIKLHHSITDGIGGVELAMQLFDLEEEPAEPDPMPDAPPVHVLTQWERVCDAWDHERRRTVEMATSAIPAVAGGLTRLAVAPGATWRQAGVVAASLGRMLAPASQPLSPVMTGRSLSVRFDTLSISLVDAKAAAKTADARLNDFFMAGVLGGLRRYHDHHGCHPEALRMGMPISVRTGGAAAGGGNHFVPIRFLAPLQIDDPADRMRALRTIVAEQRAEPALELADALALVVRWLPTPAQTALFGKMLRTVDVITSNVPGVAIPLYLAGARLAAQYPFGPRSGAALNITLLSYLDQLHIGVNLDPAAITDPDQLISCLHDAFDEVLRGG